MIEANFRLIDGCVNCHFSYLGYVPRNDIRQAPDDHWFCRKDVKDFKIGGICDLWKLFNREEALKEVDERQNSYNKWMNRLNSYIENIQKP